MNGKYLFTNVSRGVAVMRLDRRIGPDPDNLNRPYIDGAAFADEMYNLHKQGLNIQVRINSEGGQVVQGYNIIEAVMSCGAGTFCYGLAASMAGMVLMSGKKGKRGCYSHAVSLVHSAKNKMYPDSNLLLSINNSLKTMLTERTKFSSDKINEMMDGGEDYTFDASQMLENGMVDEVVASGRAIKREAHASASELFAIYGSINDIQTTKTMEWWKFGFGAKSEEEGVQNALDLKKAKDTADAEVARLKAENAAKDGEITNLKSQVEAAGKAESKAKATALVENAVKAKKFVPKDEAEKASMIAMAENNYSLAEKLLSKAGGETQKVAAAIDNAQGAAELKATGDKTYEYLAKNNPEELERIANDDPELFNRLADEHNQKLRGRK